MYSDSILCGLLVLMFQKGRTVFSIEVSDCFNSKGMLGRQCQRTGSLRWKTVATPGVNNINATTRPPQWCQPRIKH